MIQIAPERATEIYKRGMDYGFSRVIVGAHWQSDVDNSRMAASLLFSVLQTNSDFQTMMKEAQQEYKQKTTANIQSMNVNTLNRTGRIYSINGIPADAQTHGILISEGHKKLQ